VRRFESLPDHLELWPAHVGGSLCGGGSLSPKTSSTVGYERRANPLLRTADRDAFLDALTRCTPPRPPTVERVVALNRDGAAQPGPLPELDCSALGTLLRAGGTVLDARTPEAFDRGHFAGAVNLPASGRGLGTRAGWAVGAGRGPIAVIAESAAAALAVSERLYAAGVWDIAGVAAADPAAWAKAGLPVRTAGALTAERLVPALVSGEISLIDVRDADEWRAGHIAGSLHLPLHELGDGDGVELPTGAPLAVACASGGRAAIAASVLRRRGGAPVWRVAGGVADIARHGAVLAS
jgi:rhodanese-related sulfurtransferase